MAAYGLHSTISLLERMRNPRCYTCGNVRVFMSRTLDIYDTVYRSKGLTELQLAELGYNDTIVFRPGSIGNAERPGDNRPLENILMYAPAHVLYSWSPTVPSLRRTAQFSSTHRGSRRACTLRYVYRSTSSISTTDLNHRVRLKR